MPPEAAPAEIVKLQQKQEAKFVCSACGADRGCDCNAPAVEKLAEMVEQRRKAKRAFDERKRQQKQQSSNITDDVEKDRQECVALYQKVERAEQELAQYQADRKTKENQSSRHVTDSYSATKPKRPTYEPEPGGEIARLKRLYGEDLKPQPIQQELKDVAVGACERMNLSTLQDFALDFDRIYSTRRNGGGA